MRYIYNFILLLSLVVIFAVGCTKFITAGRNLEKIKILRITGATQLEIMRNGAYEVVSLTGVYIPTDDDISKNYFDSGIIDKKNRSLIDIEAAKARMFLYDSFSSGDLVYAETAAAGSQNIRVREFILYTPDMVSVNEKLVAAGYAFPQNTIADKKFSDRLYKNLNEAVADRRGLWMIGEKILVQSGSVQKQIPAQPQSTPSPIPTATPAPQ
jgi:hypothetical protein